MRTLVVGMLLLAFLAISASGYRFYGPYDIFQPRAARWPTRLKSEGWLGAGAHGGPLRSSIQETDPDYYPKLINWLDQVGRR